MPDRRGDRTDARHLPTPGRRVDRIDRTDADTKLNRLFPSETPSNQPNPIVNKTCYNVTFPQLSIAALHVAAPTCRKRAVLSGGVAEELVATAMLSLFGPPHCRSVPACAIGIVGADEVQHGLA